MIEELQNLLRDDSRLTQAFENLAVWTEDLKQDCDLGWPLTLGSVLERQDELKEYLKTLATYKDHPALQKNKWEHRALLGMAEYGANVGQFLQLVTRFQHEQDDMDPIRRLTGRVHGELKNAGWPYLVAELLLDGKQSRLVELDDAHTVLSALNGESPPPRCPEGTSIPDWALDYPHDLRREIAILDSLVDDAETVFRKEWDRAGPDESALRKQIAILSQKIAKDPGNTRLARGLANKREQLRESTTLAERRTKALKKRLTRLIRDRVCDVWHQSLWNKIEQRVNDIIGSTVIPVELHDGQLHQKTRRILAGIIRVDGWARDLAVRLLRLRLSSPEPPWDVNGDPQNRQFLASMARLGIDTRPWLSSFEKSVTAKSGEQLSLALEQDPLEIFYMGGYFDTCLSPDSFTFFSAVSVAADVNKQVLFARNTKGEVVGRCLLALARNGGLLAFHPYGYLANDEFSKIASDYVAELAEGMNTTVLRKGESTAWSHTIGTTMARKRSATDCHASEKAQACGTNSQRLRSAICCLCSSENLLPWKSMM